MTLTEIEDLATKAETACEALRDALQEYFDDKSARWQESEKGDEWQNLIDSAEQGYDACNSARPSNL